MFRGHSRSGAEVLVYQRGPYAWYVQIPIALDTPKILGALALVHRERQRFA
jgi:hypothetical protein